MKKVLLFIFLVAGVSFALIDATVPNNFTANTPARSAEVNENFDSLEVATNRLIDSLNANFIRYSDLDSADTNFNKIWIDTANITKANIETAKIDSAYIADGIGLFDSIYAVKSVLNYTDISDGKAILDSATITKFTATNASITNSSGTSLVYDTVYSRSFAGDDLNADSILALGVTATKGNIDTIIADKITSSVSSIGEATATAFTANTVNTGNGNNELYAMDQNVTTTSDVIFDSIAASKGVFSGSLSSATLNTGNGDNELYPMNQAVRTTDDVIFDSIAATRIVVSSSSSLGAATATTINTGNGANELYAMDQNVRTTDAVVFTTVNTGNGANELYPMNQGVLTTSDVVFDSLYTTASRSAKTYIDTINQLQNKTYAKSDSLLYSKKASTEYLLSSWENNTGYISSTWKNTGVYSATGSDNNGIRIANIPDVANRLSNQYAGITLTAISAQANIYCIATDSSSAATTLAVRMRNSAGSRFEHLRLNPTGEIQLNNTTETIATPSGGAKLYASGGRLYAEDTTGQVSTLTPQKGSFSLTYKGSTGGGTVYYEIKDSLVHLVFSDDFGDKAISGDSMSFTGLPTVLQANQIHIPCMAVDSGRVVSARMCISYPNAGEITIWKANRANFSNTALGNLEAKMPASFITYKKRP